MNFAELINKKKKGLALSKEEIDYLIAGFVSNEIKDYQMSAMSMAIYFKGMNSLETSNLTGAMVNSGKTYDLKAVSGFKVDKHSTGGVGDKTSLIYAPLVASFGLKVAKLSGRGLGQTGGTIDKLESCPGWTGEVSEAKFEEIVNKVGMSIISQSGEIVPADKKLYALRDVTGTVDSIPLIASSIMSKKLAIAGNGIILDVKMGSGAFMETIEQATLLAQTMVEIGKNHNRNIAAMITDMDKPLGRQIGNANEVREAYETLLGKGPADLVELTETAVGITLLQAKLFKDLPAAKLAARQRLVSGEAAPILKQFINAQGGDFGVIENYDKNFITKNKIEVLASKSGNVRYCDTDRLGLLAMKIGAGRATKEDSIDYAAGISLNKGSGEYVKAGEVVMTLMTNKPIVSDFTASAEMTFEIVDKEFHEPVIIKIISDLKID
ncbi:thymidine phosphorylase [Spiroplasma sabaudiense Ar-1343]|uniref:Thymidine phosphorylase n=1 Tax=Spiroplasma sabaudiense Ar-1343 TaxID=1276257 RepID=W6A9Y3_9MOLU|nr:thymidine phosphorylase [Spiroplasma sabaudiense]AHI53988.1 thymidine phosphorylase [Spiroplasma sabaudiense Ar-1343]